MFRQIKEMKAMLEGASGMMQQAELMDEQTRQLAVARRAVQQVRRAQAYGMPAGHAQTQVEPSFDPVAGVTLEQYAAICAGAAEFGNDPSKMAEVAEARGISPAAWQAAVKGWNARLRAHAAVARQFNLRYREA